MEETKQTNSRKKQTRRNRDHAEREKINEKLSKLPKIIFKRETYSQKIIKDQDFMLFLKNEDDFKNKRALKK